MIYLLSALILLILLIAVTVLESSRPSPFWKWLNLGLTGSGVIIVFLCHVIGNRMIAGSAQTEMWMAWAKDMLAQHYTISLPLLGVLGGILLLSWTLSLSEKRHK